VCERRASGERKYYLANHPAETTLEALATAIKARWVCAQAHQQLKDELGLDHCEGRGWLGRHHHALLTLIALGLLQHLRLRRLGGGNPHPAARGRRPRRPCRGCGGAPRRGPELLPAPLPALPAARPLPPPTVNVAE
jgi:SRSO17 transposase